MKVTVERVISAVHECLHGPQHRTLITGGWHLILLMDRT